MTRQKTLTTLAYYATFIALGISMASLGPTLPGLAQNVASSLALIGALFTVRSLGSLLISSLSGRIYDRLRGHRVMAAMIVAITVFTVLTPFLRSFWVLAALLLLTGAVQGLLNIGSNTLLVWLHGDEVSPFMIGLHFFFGVGTVVAPVIVAQLVMLQGGLVWTYLLLALIVLPTAVVAFLPSPPPPKSKQVNGRGEIDWGLIILIALIFACYGGVGTAFGGWIYTYVIKYNLADATQAAYLNSLFWGGLTIGRLVAIPVALKLKPQVILRIDFTGAFLCMLVMLFWPQSLPAVMFTTGSLGFFLASIYPTTMSMSGQLMAISGKITGYFSIGSSIGMMVVPWLVGLLFELFGPKSLIVVLLFVMLLAFIVLAGLALKMGKTQLEEIQA
jgi:FHS family Na+ dependent glucose MFS transporter 1